MKLQVLFIGIILLVIGGIIGAVGIAEFFSDLSPSSIGLVVLGGALFFAGIMVTLIGGVVKAVPHLKEMRQSPIFRERETVVTREVLIQCRSCGARSLQGTTKCLTCGASL